jgi:hypothetical protein
VLLSALLHAILHPSHHLLNVLLQIANKLGLSKKKQQKNKKKMWEIPTLGYKTMIQGVIAKNTHSKIYFFTEWLSLSSPQLETSL